MRIINNTRRGWVFAIAALAVLLAGCSTGYTVPPLTGQNVLGMSCQDVRASIEQLDAAAKGSAADREKFAKQAGIDLKKDKDLKKARERLVAHETVVCDPGTKDIKVDAATIKALTVSTGTYKCKVDANGLVAYADMDKSRWYAADSYGPKLSKSPGLKEMQARFCARPIDAITFLHWFANLEFKNWKTTDGNPWVAKFKDVDIREEAAYYMPLVDEEKPTDEAVKLAVVRNREWQVVASKAATLLAQTKVVGVQSLLSSKNYHAPGWELDLPGVVLNKDYQEDKPALVFVRKNKIGQCLVKFGFNVKDGRLEQFSCKTPPTKTKTTTPGGKKPSGHKPGGKNPPNGKCKVNCGTKGKTGHNKSAVGNRKENHKVGQGESTRHQSDPQADAKRAAEKAAREKAAREKAAREAAERAQTNSGHGSSDNTNTGNSGNGDAGEDNSGDIWGG